MSSVRMHRTVRLSPEQGAVRSDEEQITSQSFVTADGSVFAATVTDMFEQIIPDVLEQIQQ